MPVPRPPLNTNAVSTTRLTTPPVGRRPRLVKSTRVLTRGWIADLRSPRVQECRMALLPGDLLLNS